MEVEFLTNELLNKTKKLSATVTSKGKICKHPRAFILDQGNHQEPAVLQTKIRKSTHLENYKFQQSKTQSRPLQFTLCPFSRISREQG